MKLYKTVLLLILTATLGSCDEAINPGDLNGSWEGGIEMYNNKPNLKTSYIFIANEKDSTYGDFYIHYDGVHEETLDDGTEISVAFQVSDKGKYSLADNELTLTYYPDSVGCRVNPDHVKAFAIKSNPKATEEELEQEVGFFTGFINESFKEEIKKNKTETFIIKLTPTEFSYNTTDGRTVNLTKSKT